MKNNNLVPIRSTAQARELGRKGGLVRSNKKKEAARLREMRKRELSHKDLEWLKLIIIDPGASAFDILLFIEVLKEKVFCEEGTIKEKVKVLNLMMNWHKLWHGPRKN